MKWILILLSQLIVYAVIAQQSISGIVLDFNNQPLEFANVVLTTSDNEIINGTITDKNGSFAID
jgi:hypothetical protein